MTRGGRCTLLLAACLVAAIGMPVAFELWLRWSQPLRDDGFPPDLFIPDALRGYQLAPGIRVDVQRIRPFRIEVNSGGYRDRPWEADPRPRVLMVGSSVLFGFGVQAQERLSERLEQHLGARYRVLNAAVYGYGPPQARATIEKECIAQRPVLVLYVHEYKLTRRDFLADPGRTVIAGQLVNISTGPQEPVSAAAQAPQGAAVLSFARTRAWLWRQDIHPRQVAERLKAHTPAEYLPRYVTTAESAEFPADGAQRAAEQIVAMARAATACGARFAAVVLPGPYEHRYAEEPATTRLLAHLGSKVPVIDLRPELRDRPILVLEGLDYFDAPALDGFAAALAHELRRFSLLGAP